MHTRTRARGNPGAVVPAGDGRPPVTGSVGGGGGGGGVLAPPLLLSTA